MLSAPAPGRVIGKVLTSIASCKGTAFAASHLNQQAHDLDPFKTFLFPATCDHEGLSIHFSASKILLCPSSSTMIN